MEIKIDTQKDSKEDIKKAIEFLNRVIEQEEEPKESIKIFKEEAVDRKKLKKDKIQFDEEEPSEKIKIVEY